MSLRPRPSRGSHSDCIRCGALGKVNMGSGRRGWIRFRPCHFFIYSFRIAFTDREPTSYSPAWDSCVKGGVWGWVGSVAASPHRRLCAGDIARGRDRNGAGRGLDRSGRWWSGEVLRWQGKARDSVREGYRTRHKAPRLLLDLWGGGIDHGDNSLQDGFGQVRR